MTEAGQPAPTELLVIEDGERSLAATVSGEGPTLLLMHPLALSGGVWAEFADRLTSQLRVVRLDARGHGASTWDGKPFTVEEMAQDAIRVLDALEVDTAHLLGMSMGGTTAIALAGHWPDRIESLVLADTTAWYGADAPEVWEQRAVSAVNTPREKQIEFQLKRWFTDDFALGDSEAVRRATDIFVQTKSEVHAAACRALGAADVRELLPQITARTLALAGDQDFATPPAMGQAIADGVDGAWFLPIPDLRHLSLIERPDLAGIVLAHIWQEPRP